MWARIESNKIVEYYDRKQSIVLNNVRYSSQIFTIWTDAQRKDLGIVPVVISGSHLDTNYYIEKNHSDAIAGDGNSVIRTIGVKAADRKLDDEDATDEAGNKLKDKMYYHHTGYIGGIKSISLEKQLDKAPDRVIKIAVKGMLPKNSLGRTMFSKLKVYAGEDHPHTAQQPKVLEI